MAELNWNPEVNSVACKLSLQLGQPSGTSVLWLNQRKQSVWLWAYRLINVSYRKISEKTMSTQELKFTCEYLTLECLLFYIWGGKHLNRQCGQPKVATHWPALPWRPAPPEPLPGLPASWECDSRPHLLTELSALSLPSWHSPLFTGDFTHLFICFSCLTPHQNVNSTGQWPCPLFLPSVCWTNNSLFRWRLSFRIMWCISDRPDDHTKL